MKIGLIGTTGHWHSYAGALTAIPGVELAAVALSGPGEKLTEFDGAPGISPHTARFETPLELLERTKLDAVQICSRPDLLADLSRAALERGVAVFSEKPVAMNLPTLEKLYDTVRRTRIPFLPMHTMRNYPEFQAVREAVRGGRIGDALLAFSQKSYRWGQRADWFKTRTTFPGTIPYVGIHAIDWLYWMLGDVFTRVQGAEGAARSDFPGCASQSALALTMKNGGAAAITLDYLRPAAALTHGDDRVRIAGSKGVVEARLAEKLATLVTDNDPPAPLTLPPAGDMFSDWLRSIHNNDVQGKCMSVYDAFRVTEIALRSQEAAETGRTMELTTIFDTPARVPVTRPVSGA